MPAADYRILTDATGQRIAAAVEALGGAVDFINPYSGVRVYKSGNVVEISVEGFSAQQAYSANDVLFTLPEGYRPRFNISFLDALNSGKRIIVESTGKVYVTTALSSGDLLRGCVAYIC